MLAALTACATPGAAEQAARLRAGLERDGLALIVDACIYRQNPPLVSNYFLQRESTDAAAAMLRTLGQRLQARRLKLRYSAAPYLCGSLADDPPSRPKVADQLGATARVVTEFPVPLDPTRLAAGPFAAQRQLLQLASETLHEPRPGRTKRVLPLAQRALLKAAYGSSELLVVVARGASISTGLATTDVVMGLLLGGGGCRLGEDDCDLFSTTHEGMRADALLLDLDREEAPQPGRPVDIGDRHGLRGDIDPLKPAPYSKAAWAEALLASLELPDLSPPAGAAPR